MKRKLEELFAFTATLCSFSKLCPNFLSFLLLTVRENETKIDNSDVNFFNLN